MKKFIICLSNSGHYSDEFRMVTENEYKKLLQLEEKYGYLEAAPPKDYKFVETILKRKEFEILQIIHYC
jgi:hypothetical protein